MFLFLDGQPYVLTFEQVEGIFYRIFMDEFSEVDGVSITQWRGSYEYQALYPAMQMFVENGAITQSALDQALNAVAEINEEIERPAVLHSRVAERFLEEGIIAFNREVTEATRGIMAVCVDYDRTLTHLNRVLSIGGDGALAYGFNSSLYGNIDNVIFDGDNIAYLIADSDYVNPVRLATGSGLQFPNHITTVEVFFVGFGLIPFTWSGTNSRYEAGNTALADWFVANHGLNKDFYFVADDAPDTVTTEFEQAVAELMADEMIPAGVFTEGSVNRVVTLSNGQSINVKFSPPNEQAVKFRIELKRDRNSVYPIDDVDTIVSKFLANFSEQNALGKDITPSTYYTIHRDAPWASQIIIEYSLDDGVIWTDQVYLASYTDKFLAELAPADVTII